MTLQEFCKKYNYSESTVLNRFSAVRQKILKEKNILIKKEGKGKKANYIEEWQLNNDNRALTILDESKNLVYLTSNSLTELSQWQIGALIGIAATPYFVFRGSYSDFLEYICANPSKTNIEKIRFALHFLNNKDDIMLQTDKKDRSTFIAGLSVSAVMDFQIEIKMIRECYRIAKKHHKRNWFQLLIVWRGLEEILDSPDLIITMRELGDYLNLSEYQVRENIKILASENLLRKKLEYNVMGDTICCLGTQINLNAIY